MLTEQQLRENQRKKIFRAVCLKCLPRGSNGNLFRFAKFFADKVVDDISPYDDHYEISFYYMKNHCPYVVEFKI